MKTSIFNMSLTLPPMIEMTDIDKDLAGNRHDSNFMGCTLMTCTINKHGLCC